MKKVLAPLLGLSLILLAGCDFGRGYAPRSIANQKFTYFTKQAGGPCDAELNQKNVVYHFKHDGSYTSTFQGGEYQYGTYSYRKTGANKSQVLLSYSEVEGVYLYGYNMEYKSEKTGTWVATYSNNPGVAKKEYGTFVVEDE